MPARRRNQLAAVLIALLASGVALALPRERLNGLSIDLLTALRAALEGSPARNTPSPVVVVGIDEDTYAHSPFKGTPSVAWTNEIGRVLSALIEGGATVVGFDIIYPTSLEQSQIPFDGQTLGARVRNFDRDYRRALRRAADAGKIVLGQLHLGSRPIVPSADQRLAVHDGRNIRPLHLDTDSDVVVRRIPLFFSVDGERVPSFALELALRHVRQRPPPGGGGARLAAAGDAGLPERLTLNFGGGAADVPSYSLADLHACVASGDTDYIRRHFEGRIVLVGALLDVEDRVVTSRRFAPMRAPITPARCSLPATDQVHTFARDSISGVYVHAAAINNLLDGNPLRELRRPAEALVIAAFTLLATAALLRFPVPMAALVVVGALAVWTALAAGAFNRAVVVPLLTVPIATLVAAFAALSFRFAITDREKLLLRRSFSYYVEPRLVERIVASSTLPRLGGETRQVTIYVSDLERFTALSERLGPAELVALMNRYLDAMTEIIGRHGGFVDKYVGDGMICVFGAPLDDPDHALHAVQAALEAQAELARMNAAGLPELAGLKLRQRIGLHTGEGLVGNIGSRHRFNYTVMGDIANVAARLEGANKVYGSAIMASEATARLCGDAIVWRELDQTRVAGRSAPVRILEPLAEAAHVSHALKAHAQAYADGLALWRAGRFADASVAFGRHADADRPAALFQERCAAMAEAPPGPDWEPVTSLETK